MRRQTWRTRTDLVIWRWQDAGTFLSANRSGYLEGAVATPHGFVRAYTMASAVNPDGRGPTSRVQFVWKGSAYMRSYNKALTRLGLARAANRLARDVVSGRVTV